MTDCAMCGDCCENIHLSVDRGSIVKALATGRVAGVWAKDANFILKNMLPDGTVKRDGKYVKQTLQCAKFDKTTRKCTAHDERPQLCRQYPFYGKDPKDYGGDTTMGGRCSFLADAGYKMLPIVEVRNGKSE